MKQRRILALAMASGLLLNVSCSSSSDDSGNANTDAGPLGGAVSGATDTHCAGTPVTVDPATCSGDTSAGGAADTGETPEPGAGGAADCNQTHDADYGDTLYNHAGDDDDCKYQTSWSSTPIRLNEPVMFILNASNLASGDPLVPLEDGAVPLTRVDVYQPCDPNRRGPASNYGAPISQTMAGEFAAGPLTFDRSGRWVVRFHLYEQCVDGETSPHGHVAFFVDVP